MSKHNTNNGLTNMNSEKQVETASEKCLKQMRHAEPLCCVLLNRITVAIV